MSVATDSAAVSALSSELSRQRAAAWRRYVALLELPPQEAREAKSIAALHTAAGTIGKSLEDMAADAKVLAQAAAHRARIDKAKGSDGAFAEADKAVKDYDAETARILKERRQEYFRLYEQYRRISYSRVMAQESKRELERLSRAHPELLGEQST